MALKLKGMRTLILIGFFACIYLHFQSRSKGVEEDSLSTQQSAIRKPTFKAPAPAEPKIVHLEEKAPVETYEVATQEEMITDEDVADEVAQSDDMMALPWDDIEEGWKTQLKEYLAYADPERGEEIFNAYLEEKKRFIERIDFGDAENGVSEDGVAQDLASSDAEAFPEYDGAEGELDHVHTQNLRDIFGYHYEQIEALHRDYVESVQYLNRSPVKFSISL